MLPQADANYLAERQIAHELTTEQGMLNVVFSGFALPVGLDRPAADLLIRLASGYPDIAPDMWWFDPAVRLPNGQSIPATEVVEPYLGRQWQRWSRHLQPSQWQPGRDGLESYLALIRRDLARWAQPA